MEALTRTTVCNSDLSSHVCKQSQKNYRAHAVYMCRSHPYPRKVYIYSACHLYSLRLTPMMSCICLVYTNVLSHSTACPDSLVCQDGTVRLVTSDSGDGLEGILEICYRSVWTRICFIHNYYFDYYAARVACRQLGLSDRGKRVSYKSNLGVCMWV